MALYFNGKPVFSESGTKSLPWAEYQALSQAEKNNGTIYFITDVNGDFQSFQPVFFSEEEREIGVWIDGKPLYQKSFVFTSSLTISDNWTLTPFTIQNLENITDGIIWRIDCRGAIYIDCSSTGNGIQISTKSKNTNFAANSVLTVRYTKTTDTAGSGTWTPQGVPAHHYSEDERIVGTWVDGSTLYEKTVIVPITANTSFDVILAWLQENDTVFIKEGFLLSGGARRVLNFYVTSNFYGYTNVDWYNNAMHLGGTINGYSGNAYVTLRYTKSST